MTETPPSKLYELACPVMDYDWGNSDPEGIIKQLLAAAGQPVPQGPTAELWMGAHPKGPARIVAEEEGDLRSAIFENPDHFLGPRLGGRGLRELPFLFKVLDAKRPLSVQAHPTKADAARLHQRDPNNYPDSNHKPELAVCVSDMAALIGFRRPEQISASLRIVPELAAICAGASDVFSGAHPGRPELLSTEQKRGWLRKCFGHLLRSSPMAIREAVRANKTRLAIMSDYLRQEDRLFQDLLQDFDESDPGVFCSYFLNYVELAPGEALFLGPNEPHAYLKGQMLECMANSDNVVRVGLTSKFRDVEALLEILNFRFGPVQTLQPTKGPERDSYPVPVGDFSLERVQLDGRKLFRDRSHNRPSILLFWSGSARVRVGMAIHSEEAIGDSGIRAERGTVLFVPGDLDYRMLEFSVLAGDEGVEFFRATTGPDF